MKARLLGLFAGVLFATPIFAQDAQRVINFYADETTFLESEYRVILIGNVGIDSGNLMLDADQVVVNFSEPSNEEDDADLKSVHATGNVKSRQGATQVTADKMDYDGASQKAIFTGNAVVTQGDSKVTSQEVHMNIETGVYELIGRVKGQIRGSF